MIAQLDKEYIKTRPSKTISRLISYAFFEGRPATTSGRWINKFVFFQLWILKHIPQFKKVKNPVFIIGTGRSGTTILGLFLSMHPKLGYLNEPKAMWNSIYENEDIIGSYTTQLGRYRLSENDATDSVIKKAHKIFSGYLAFIFTERVVDKYPELVFRIPFIKKIFPDAKFIFLQRNPWDTCNSINSWSQRKAVQNDHIEDWWGVNDQKWKIMLNELIKNDETLSIVKNEIENFTDHKHRALVEWYLVMKEGIKMQAQFKNDIITLKYEDLAKNPSIELKKILHFCELSIDSKMLEYSEKVISAAPETNKFLIPDVLVDPIEKIMKLLDYK